MNYKLVKRNTREYILEKETDFLYGPFEDRDKAREKMRFMNGGGVFDGYTPSFMSNGKDSTILYQKNP